MAEPSAPDAATRDAVLALLAELIARAGADEFLRAPVAPGAAAFPDPWAPSAAGVQVLLRRLAWHAGLERCGVKTVVVEDRRAGKPVTERMPATRIEATHVRDGTATFVLGYVGADDVAGTAAHEVGAVFAALHRSGRADPYRSAEPPELEIDASDAERGSVATVVIGLGVLAANAAFQEYSRAGRFNGAYEALEHDVLRAGVVPMSVLAYALAVQAVVRAEVAGSAGDAQVPNGLRRPQADEVRAWIAALRGQGARLCERLGVAGDQRHRERPAAVAFADVSNVAEEARERRLAFRWRTHRGGVGLMAGTVLGFGVALLASRGLAPWVVLGSATGGHVMGRKVRAMRCSACAHLVREGACACERCGAVLRGDIDRLDDRLEAEERIERADAEARAGTSDDTHGSRPSL
jgi:hypothetical protein